MKKTTRRKRTAKVQADRTLPLLVREARTTLRRRLAAALDALDALAVAEEELLRRWSEFALTRPVTREPAQSGIRARCRCGAAIELNADGQWIDAGSVGLVFCTDQDITHDAERHAPVAGG